MQNYQIWPGNTYGKGDFFRGLATPLSQRCRAQYSPIFGLLFCRWLHSLKKNDQIWHGNTYGEGVFSGGPPRHYICLNALHGCRWVSCLHRLICGSFSWSYNRTVYILLVLYCWQETEAWRCLSTSSLLDGCKGACTFLSYAKTRQAVCRQHTSTYINATVSMRSPVIYIVDMVHITANNYHFFTVRKVVQHNFDRRQHRRNNYDSEPQQFIGPFLSVYSPFSSLTWLDDRKDIRL